MAAGPGAFQPIKRLAGFDELPEAERALLEQLNAIRLDLARLLAPPAVTQLQTSSTNAALDEVVRCAPNGSMTLRLPEARLENRGRTVTVLLESVTRGNLTVQAIGGLVNGQDTQTVSLVCRLDFVSDGVAGWRSEVAPGAIPLTSLASQIAESFLGNFTAAAASPTARAGSSVAGAGLTYSAGGTLAVGAGTGITVAADAVGLTDMAARRVKLRADSAGTGAPIDGTGAQVGEILRLATINGAPGDSTSTGTIQTYTLAEASNIVRFLVGIGATTLRGATIPAEDGQRVIWENNDGSGATVTFNHEDGSAAAAGNRFRCPGAANYALTAGHRIETCYINQRHRIIATA